MRFFFALLIGALLLCAIAGTTLAFDGSYYLYEALELGTPTAPNRRLIHDPLQRPMLLLSHYTNDVGVLQTAFGLAYIGVPIFALAASWVVVRKRNPSLFLWAAFGIGIGTLPGQIGWISEAASIWQLFWPVACMLVLRVRWREVPLLLALCVLIFLSNPQCALIFGAGALLSLAAGWHFRAERVNRWGWALFFVLLCAAAALRFALEVNPYETEQLGFALLGTRFFSAFANLPLLALLCAMSAGLALIFAQAKRQPLAAAPPHTRHTRFENTRAWLLRMATPRTIHRLMWLCGGVLILRAVVPSLWADSLNYRFFLPLAVFPFMALGLLDFIVSGPRSAMRPQHLRLIRVVGLVFALSLSIQSLEWVAMTQLMRQSMNRSDAVCLSVNSDELRWISYTIFNHWSVTPYSILIQGQRPTKIIMPENLCAQPGSIDQFGIRIAEWEKRQWQRVGWFDFSRMVQPQ